MTTNDNPLDSEETLRLMTTLAELADLYQPNTGDVREAMEQARHRLAILQQFANGQGPFSKAPDPQAMQPVDTLAQQLMILVSRIGYSDQGDYYEVDSAGWEALQRAVEHNIDQQTISTIRTAAKLQRESPPVNECPTCGDGQYMGRHCIDCGRDARLI